MSDTSIPVTDPVWSELNARKERGETFDDVLRRELGMEGAAHTAHANGGSDD